MASENITKFTFPDSPTNTHSTTSTNTSMTVKHLNPNDPRPGRSLWYRASNSIRSVRRSFKKSILIGQSRAWSSNDHAQGGSSSSNNSLKMVTNQLYHAISAENWHQVMEICDTKPIKAELWHTVPGFFDAIHASTLLPLHMACALAAPDEVLLALFQAYPPAALAKESYYGRLPIHIACRSSVNTKQIRVLASVCPSSCFEQDILGRIPLHYVLNNCPDLSLVRELLITAMEAAGERGLLELAQAEDFKGWLPIHVACRSLVSVDILRLLIQIYPGGATAETKAGTTAIQLVKKMNIPDEKRSLIEGILMGTEENPPPKLELKRDPDEVPVMTFETARRV